MDRLTFIFANINLLSLTLGVCTTAIGILSTSLSIGDTVLVNVDMDTFERQQEGHGGWCMSMTTVIIRSYKNKNEKYNYLHSQHLFNNVREWKNNHDL